MYAPLNFTIDFFRAIMMNLEQDLRQKLSIKSIGSNKKCIFAVPIFNMVHRKMYTAIYFPSTYLSNGAYAHRDIYLILMAL